MIHIKVIGKERIEEIIEFDSIMSWEYIKERIKSKLSFNEYKKRHRKVFMNLYNGCEKVYFIVALNEDKKIIGLAWLGIKFDTIDYMYVGYIYDIEVAKEYRNRGIGTKLMHKALEICKNNEIKRMALSVDILNKPALKWYFKLGFKPKRFYLEKILEDCL